MRNIKIILTIFVSVVLAGCSTVVEKTYRNITIGSDQKDLFDVPKNVSEIVVERIKFEGQDLSELMSTRFPDYRILGFAGFKTAGVGDSELKKQALASGASLVALVSKWEGTFQSGTVASAVPMSGGGALALAIPVMADRFEYQAIFLGKYLGGKDRIGITFKPLPIELQQKLETNKGILIDKVTPRGPAFDANLLAGDVMIKVNGTVVLDQNSSAELIRGACRKSLPFYLSVLRGPDANQRELKVIRCE